MPQAWGSVGELDWGDYPVYLIGGGPSLEPYVDRLRPLAMRAWVVGTNDSYKHASCHAIVSLDHTWLERRRAEIPSIPAPVFVAVAEDHPRPEIPNLTYLRRVQRAPHARLSLDPSVITNGLNSGYAALNYAVLRGAKEVYLLGYDFNPASNGRSHYHEGYEWHSPTNSGRMYPAWARILDQAADQLRELGVAVYNCSPTSRLTAYPYRPYSEVL